MLPAILRPTKSLFIVPAKLAFCVAYLDAAMGTDQFLCCTPNYVNARYRQSREGFRRIWSSAAHGFKTATNFIMIAYLRMSKLKHLPSNPLVGTCRFPEIQRASPSLPVMSSSTLNGIEPFVFALLNHYFSLVNNL
jgi:hypothetical protein